MALRSVLDIDVNTAQFDAYRAAFDKYAALVKKLPDDYAASWKVLNKHKGSFQEIVAGMVAQKALSKQHAAAMKEADRLTRTQADSWKSIAKSSESFVKSIEAAGATMLRWVAPLTIVSGLLGGAGLLGIDRLAGSVSGQRRNALGLGVPYGQAASFNLNYGRFVDTQSLLSGVSGSLYNATSPGYVGLLAAGISPEFLNSHNAAEVSAELLNRLPKLLKGTPRNLIGARLSSLHLDTLVSPEDAIRTQALQGELGAQNKQFQANSSALGLSGSDQLRWTNLNTQLERAGSEIENIFVRGLTKLADPIGHLSDSFEKAVKAFVGSDTVKNGIEMLGSGLETFAKYIGTPEFQKDVKDVADSFAYAAKQLVAAARWLGLLPSSEATAPAAVLANDNVVQGGANAKLFYDAVHRGGYGHGKKAGSFLRPPSGRSDLGSAEFTNQFSGTESPDQVVLKLNLMRAAGQISNEQCVALSAAAMGHRPGSWNVHNWRRGEGADAGGLTAGQAIATFLNPDGTTSNRYAGGGTGTEGANRDHAGVFESYIRGKDGKPIGMNVAEQYRGSNGIHSKAYYFGSGNGEQNGSNYYRIQEPTKVTIHDNTGGNVGISTTQAAGGG